MRDGLTHYSVQLVLVHPVGANGNCRRTLLTICGVTTSANLYGVKPELPTDWIGVGETQSIGEWLEWDTHPATHPADRAKRIAIVIDGLRPPRRIGQLSPPNVETASGTEC
jgi:hypothetical protein